MSSEFQLGRWVVQPDQNAISCNGKSARLEPKMVEVLVCLAEHAGETVSKEQLLRRVWGDTFVTDDVLTRCVSELRRVLEDDPKEPQFIQTIPRKGYRLVPQVRPAGQPPLPSPAVSDVPTASQLHRLRWTSAGASITGGETGQITAPFMNFVLNDVSPNGSELLLTGADLAESRVWESPLWVLPLPTGTRRRIGDIVATTAAWSHDGRRIVYTQRHDVYICNYLQ